MRSNEANRFIGARLRQERLLAGKSQEELGRALGVGPEFVCAYERGAARLPAKLLVTATQMLGLPVGLLFYADDRQKLSGGDADADTGPRLAIRRPPSILSHPGFEQLAPIVRLWRDRRGQASDDVHRVIRATGLFQRTILVRHVSSSRLVVEHLGAGIRILRPCEALLAIGSDWGDWDGMPHRDYGAWVAQAYDEALWSRRLGVESVRASVRTSAGTILRTRYDRVLMPWRGTGSETFVMGVSIRREPLREAS